MLPIEMIEKIALYYSDLCYSLMFVFKIDRFLLPSTQIYLKNIFTKKIIVEGLEVYRLPNRGYDQPTVIYPNGRKEWCSS